MRLQGGARAPHHAHPALVTTPRTVSPLPRHLPQLALVEVERESLQRRLRHLQMALDDEKAKTEQAAEMQAAAIQKALASRLTQLEDLKACDKRIVAEVCVCVCVHVCLCARLCARVHVGACVRVRVCACVRLCAWVCLRARPAGAPACASRSITALCEALSRGGWQATYAASARAF
jgi:hypothetical protein